MAFQYSQPLSAEGFEDTHPGSQIHLRGQNYRLLEQIRGKIQQKNRTHNLILSNLKSIVQTILIGVVYSISALSSPWHSRSNDNIKVHIFDNIFDHTLLMSGIFPVCMYLVKGCQTLVMDPTSLLQQSLVNTVPHCKMVHWYLLLSG